jgi:MinD-like ATPase involved in chromosome partitioning or flagellar assembly
MDETNRTSHGVGRIYWIGGSKGGVGKSMMTLATLDYLLERGEQVFLVECDSSNPDVWKTYGQQIEGETLDLDEANGWIRLVNSCDAHRDRLVVINTAARNNLAVTQFGRTLDASLDELGAELVAFWMINRQRDSVELLMQFMEAMPNANVHVVRNGHFGEPHQFELYNASKVREAIEKRGGKSVTLPDLADRVADDIYSQRMALHVAAKTMPIGNRAELGRWRGEVRKVLAEVLG